LLIDPAHTLDGAHVVGNLWPQGSRGAVSISP
jgi:hypothetical protein